MHALLVAVAASLLPLPVHLVRVAPPIPPADPVRAAVERALPLLEKGAAGYVANRQCFSCHNQTLPILAMHTARSRGLAVNAKELDRQLRHTADSLGRGKAAYRKGQGQGGQADTAGYALFALDVGGRKPDDTTEAVVEYLLQRDADRDHWRTTSRRPPSEASPFTTTYLALRSLRAYATPAQQKRVQARLARVLPWLRKTPARDTEDRVFRLWGLKLAGAADKEVRQAAAELLADQREDGGWAQTDELDSDAYATGTALVALHHAAGLGVTEKAYRRGVRFLLTSQRPDGSWYVRSRSKPFQTYFESGFPHGKDQFISIAASGWAATALALALGQAKTAYEPAGLILHGTRVVTVDAMFRIGQAVAVRDGKCIVVDSDRHPPLSRR